MLEFFILVAITAALTRFLRQGEAVAGLRRRLASASPLAAAVLRCTHCLSFWLALALTILLGAIRHRFGDPLGWVEGPLFILLGWRGAYYINRQIDQRVQVSPEAERQARRCEVCDKPLSEEFTPRSVFLHTQVLVRVSQRAAGVVRQTFYADR